LSDKLQTVIAGSGVVQNANGQPNMIQKAAPLQEIVLPQ
jgi:hypothetical protein